MLLTVGITLVQKDKYISNDIFVDTTYNIDCDNNILFVVVVLTNCGYEPVMMSIEPNETSDTIQTALQHLKDRTIAQSHDDGR